MSKVIEPRAPPAPGGADTEAASPRLGLRDRLRGIGGACRQVIGIPDYERYLAHMAEHHPGEPVLSRQAFCANAIDRKYGKSGPRCC
jgi:uncharacterized short protein YbdD (DUF466 family)